MIRTFGGFLLALPATVVLMAAPASAQLFGSQPPAVTEQQLPPPSFGTENRYNDRGMPGRYAPAARYGNGNGEQEADALPPPGLPVQDGQNYGRPLPTAAMPGGRDPDAIRPPGVVGAAPAGGPSAAPAPIPSRSGASADAVPGTSVMTLPPEDQPETGQPKELPANLKKQLVDYSTREPAGTIIVDTPNTYLYLVLGHGKALRYGIGVGREGFEWHGTAHIALKREWPTWTPPSQMIQRQPELAKFAGGMEPGLKNPLGARAM